MKLSLTKYELWNSLFMCPDEEKTEAIKEFEELLNKSMAKGHRVIVDMMED